MQGRSGNRGNAGEVLAAFLKLGLTSFGGPVAHLGYFRDEFVFRRRWLDEGEYADLVALCQFLPGPASSQTGFALGLMRAGAAGAAAAWAAFTLPSALLLIAFAHGAGRMGGELGSGAIAGLKIVAVAIVAQAVWGMAGSLCPDRSRATIAAAAVALAVLVGGATGQIGAILGGGLAGLLLCRSGAREITGQMRVPIGRMTGALCLAAFAVLLLGLPLVAPLAPGLAVAEAFYRAGALVFGGGHVVLPLLEAAVVQPGWIGADAFLAGYGAAQAVPGPLFTFAAYLGTLLDPGPSGIAGAALALVAVFLPGILLLVGILPFWDALRTRPAAQAAMRGANAAVVGILGAALYSPVFTSAVTSPPAFVLALAGFIALTAWKAPPWAVVLASAGAGALFGLG